MLRYSKSEVLIEEKSRHSSNETDNDTEITTHFKPGEEVNIECIYKKGIILYAYCNKHGLWMKEVK